MAGLDQTPAGLRTQIGIFGKTNSGKSSVLNMITGSDTAIVSPLAGTTTDPVKKSMELGSLGPCLFIDTPGTFDPSDLSEKRQERMQSVMKACDIGLIVVKDASDVADEKERYEWLRAHDVRVLFVLNKSDDKEVEKETEEALGDMTGTGFVTVDARSGIGRDDLIEAIIKCGEGGRKDSLLKDCVSAGDCILLVMPQDKLAPKGRLILPQVMTIRELLDRDAVTIGITPEKMDEALAMLKAPPKLIITDSQVFQKVYEKKPPESLITSFSILMAGLKGDLKVYAKGAAAIDRLHDGSRVLIAESCTHAPADEDIGRVKIPSLIRKRRGGDIEFDICAGDAFPKDLSGYDLIIQCGGCMAGRKLIMSRIEEAKEAGVSITNYGLAIAYLSGIFDKIYIP